MREGHLAKADVAAISFSCPCLFPCRDLRPTSIRTRVSVLLARCTLRSIIQVGAAIQPD